MAHHWLGIGGMQTPSLLVGFRFLNSHSHSQAKMFRPCRNLVLQPKDTALVETLINPALERAVAPKSGLHLLCQNAELLAVIVRNKIVDRDGNRTLLVFGKNLQLVRVVERRLLDMRLDGEVDRKTEAESENNHRDHGRANKG